MDHHVWKLVYHTIKRVDRNVPKAKRKPTYSDAQIVAMYLWSVWHDRPLCWACRRSSYNRWFRPRRLPSVSQFCKRIKTSRIEMLLQETHQALVQDEQMSHLSFLDGRALRVGSYSKDQQATRGYAGGGFARGYKLHAWATEKGFIPTWSVMPLNVNEKTVATPLIKQAQPQGLVLADKNYDARHLYDEVASFGGQLITPLPRNVGGGHHAQSHARMLAAWAWRGIAGYVYRERLAIERFFGQLACLGGGLDNLPSWVRTLARVRRWVGAKLILYHAHKHPRKAVS